MEPLLVLLAPYAPHLAEELWSTLGHGETIFTAPWPGYDDRIAAGGDVEIAVQVNGKLRGLINVPRGTTQDDVVKRALADEGIRKFVDGKPIRKTVYVQDRLLNLVV